MRISVVIPVYNEELYLPITLQSLSRLRRKPDEVIVVDSYSTDKTVSVATSCGARVIQAPKTTIGAARQYGLQAATGEVVATTDADTIVPADWLTKFEETLTKPGVVAAYGRYKIVDGWLPYRLTTNILNPFVFRFGPLVGVHIVCGQNMSFWKDKALTVGGFPVDFQSVEDYEMMRRLKTAGRVVYRADNTVFSSGRRGKEGWKLFSRIGGGFFHYFVTGEADKFTFPDMR
jgi:glycosyltransferase involved in cell wall biosynthesis